MNFKKYRVGEIRPSQLLTTYGVGSIIDLPHLAVLVMGLEDWDTSRTENIPEERLLAAIRSKLGMPVNQLLSPPAASESVAYKPFAPGSLTGVPVATFPRWMVCPLCKLLASVDDFFELRSNSRQPDQVRYVHQNCPKGNAPTVLPSRFMMACDAGHLDDFPWHHFVHGDRQCKASLYMVEVGVSGEPSDIYIQCRACDSKSRPMSDAFSSLEELVYTPTCRGRRPHLRDFKPPCKANAKAVLLSASNTWFPLIFSSLALPSATADELGKLIEAHWDLWQAADDLSDVKAFRKQAKYRAYYLDYSNEEIWQRIEKQKTATDNSEHAGNLKVPEWEVLTHTHNAPKSADFVVRTENLPEGYYDTIQKVVLVERLREVRALTGFTRLESLADYTEEEELPRDHIMPLTRGLLSWVPAAEVRGEGIFIQFREDALSAWLERPEIKKHAELFHAAHKRWREARHIDEPEENDPGMRYVLLHTFSHALMRRLTLESGYSAASIRERIYAQSAQHEGGAMAGILLYTAASDSEGTLGGLVDLGRNLGYHIEGALEDMQNCTSDPLCAEHICLEDDTLHGSACHACMFAPETSCERGNRYLDRSVLVPTVECSNLAFFSN